MAIKSTLAILLPLIVLLCFISQNATSTSIEDEHYYEELFKTIPSAAYAYEHLAFYTSLPHVAGTPEDYETAQYTLEQFKSYGLDAQIEEEDVLLSYPLSRSLKMISPHKFTATLQEDYEPLDPTSGDPRVIPTFNGYAPTGNVTGQLVYVNYGTHDDFLTLLKNNITLAGNIAIARYGSIFRGTKAMLAQKYGMIGLVIYSDPKDDGFVQGPVFPHGPWRSNSSVQRGSVQFLSICPGDPRNPKCNYQNQSNYTQNIPSIPVLPISWNDAYPLLKQIGNNPLPSTSWQGGLNFTYHAGPGPATIELAQKINFTVGPIWNVVATIPGQGSQADDVVLIGNHRDAWTFGAADPNSGTATMLEVARGFGELLKKGWKPMRTIKICSWDGEEYGLLGSTAWVEKNKQMLTDNGVVYINVDTGVTGSSFKVAGSPSLQSIILDVTKNITDPKTNKPLHNIYHGPVETMGSGSDYTSFLDNIGIPSCDLRFEGDYGVYHSVYDSMYWMKSFGAPTFQYFKALAQYWGLLTMRFVDADVLPFNYNNYATALSKYYSETRSLMAKYKQHYDTTPILDAINQFKTAAAHIETVIQNAQKSQKNLKHLNDRLKVFEREFISDLGLPLRPYYKHVIQAPGLYQGYNPDVFPGLAQAIRNGSEDLATAEISIISLHISEAALFLTHTNN